MMKPLGEKIAFRMFLLPGQAAEYKRRHDQLWPELRALLKASGISDYSIHLDEDSHVLYATLRQLPGHWVERLPEHPLMRSWWNFMSDIMRCNPDGSPLTESLPCMFHLD